MTHILILGGGAAGLAAGIAAKQQNRSLEVVVLERLDRVGKKILATGNGRCNYTNSSISRENYHGGDGRFVDDVLQAFGGDDTVAFFRNLGVEPRTDHRGRVYPYSLAASAVVDTLRLECERLGVATLCGFECASINATANGWQLTAMDGRVADGKALIVTAGGKASPSLGSNGSVFPLLAGLGFTTSELYPALVQLVVDGNDTRALKGIKVDGVAAIYCKGRCLDTQEGEILFTEHGLSGTPIFQLSVANAQTRCDTITIDLCPTICKGELLDTLSRRHERFSHLTMEHFFVGLLQKRVGYLIARRSGVDKLSLSVSSLDNNMLEKICDNIKGLRFIIRGAQGFETAQVTAGGLLTNQFDSRTMESFSHRSLYTAGEVLEVFGDCGGYNLQWAWSTGVIAGRAAARKVGDS